MHDKNFDIEFNKEQTIAGVYTKSILSQKGIGEHQGHYKIVVKDSLEINLLPPYMDESIRPPEEVESFEGKKVEVTGIVVPNTSLSEPSLEEQPLRVDIPCFVSIEHIELLED